MKVKKKKNILSIQTYLSLKKNSETKGKKLPQLIAASSQAVSPLRKGKTTEEPYNVRLEEQCAAADS